MRQKGMALMPFELNACIRAPCPEHQHHNQTFQALQPTSNLRGDLAQYVGAYYYSKLRGGVRTMYMGTGYIRRESEQLR